MPCAAPKVLSPPRARSTVAAPAIRRHRGLGHVADGLQAVDADLGSVPPAPLGDLTAASTWRAAVGPLAPCDVMSGAGGRGDMDEACQDGFRCETDEIARVVSIAVPVLVIGFLLATVVSQWGELERVDVRFDPVWLGGAFVALLAYQAMHGEVARAVLAELGQPVEGRRLRAIFAASLLARYVPTGALAIVVRIGLQEREGVPKRVGTLGLLYEVAIALVAAALLCLLLVARASLPLALGLLALSPAAIALVLGPRTFPSLANRVLARLNRQPVSRFLPISAVLRLTVVLAISFVLAGVSVLCVVQGLTDPPAGSTATK